LVYSWFGELFRGTHYLYRWFFNKLFTRFSILGNGYERCNIRGDSPCFFMVLVLFVHKQGGTRLTVAVFSYILVITWMVLTSVITEDRLLMIAALLFYVSDAVLSYDRFKKTFSSAEYIVMATYFPAQLLFTIRVITIG